MPLLVAAVSVPRLRACHGTRGAQEQPAQPPPLRRRRCLRAHSARTYAPTLPRAEVAGPGQGPCLTAYGCLMFVHSRYEASYKTAVTVFLSRLACKSLACRDSVSLDHFFFARLIASDSRPRWPPSSSQHAQLRSTPPGPIRTVSADARAAGARRHRSSSVHADTLLHLKPHLGALAVPHTPAARTTGTGIHRNSNLESAVTQVSGTPCTLCGGGGGGVCVCMCVCVHVCARACVCGWVFGCVCVECEKERASEQWNREYA